MPRTSSKNPYQFSSGDARRVRQEHLSDRRVRARLRHGLPGHVASAPLTELPRPPRTVQSVPTGVSMPPSFSTTQPGHFTLSESPRPAGLPTNHDIVSTSVGVGLPAVEALREQPDAVGPILCCPLHQVLLIPVAAGTAHVWHAPHSRCRPGGRWDCAELADHGPGPCRRLSGFSASVYWLPSTASASASTSNTPGTAALGPWCRCPAPCSSRHPPRNPNQHSSRSHLIGCPPSGRPVSSSATR